MEPAGFLALAIDSYALVSSTLLPCNWVSFNIYAYRSAAGDSWAVERADFMRQLSEYEQERVRERRGDEEEKQALTDSLLASQKCLEEV